MKIQLDLGDGFTTDENNKLGVKYEPNGNMHVETSTDPGLYVENLNGADGTGGGSQPDGWTTKPGTGWNIQTNATIPDFVDMNRDVVNLIFTFGVYRPSMRHPTYVAYSTTPKDVQSMCNEIVAPVYYNASSYTSYHPQAGELIQLVTNPLFRTVPWNGGTIATESLNRIDGNTSQETKAMFVITDIHYMSDIQQGGNIYWVHDMTLMCIYSTLPEFVVGTSYSGTQGFDNNHI
jgi:hypothetical protein